MQISANLNVLSLIDLIFVYSETLFVFVFSGLMSFGNPSSYYLKLVLLEFILSVYN